MRCGSIHCRDDHHWIHEGVYRRLNAINCGAMKDLNQEELDRYNSLEYAKELYKKLCPHLKAK